MSLPNARDALIVGLTGGIADYFIFESKGEQSAMRAFGLFATSYLWDVILSGDYLPTAASSVKDWAASIHDNALIYGLLITGSYLGVTFAVDKVYKDIDRRSYWNQMIWAYGSVLGAGYIVSPAVDMVMPKK